MFRRSQSDPVPPVEEVRKYKKPVAWLLGRQLLGSLKGTLLYTAFGSKIDPRDWMEAKVFPEETNEEVFWFDYLSDTGDGSRATYSIAYLCMSDLWVKEMWKHKPAGDDTRVEKERGEGFEKRLPRGAFLFVGGDTTYHLSDYISLANRFQLPFKWAFADLLARGRVADGDAARRPIYGIPGNHDYYDLLDGFRRQFRRPIQAERSYTKEEEELGKAPQLMLPGFRRRQEASYVALRLPFDWWFWGLDTELGEIDKRQLNFFRPEDDAAGAFPQKLIVATCAPTTVFGKYADKDEEKSAKTFFQLGLPPLFWDGKPQEAAEAADAESFDRKIEDGQCRLDLSGDVHHYARYWGPENGDAHPPARLSQAGFKGSNNHYASVVSGLGGAFHHPSQTYVGEVQEQTLYPAEEVSRREFAGRLFNPYNIIRGGYVWLLGFLIAFIIYFGATIPKSSRQAFNTFPFWNSLGISQPEQIEPTVLPLTRVTSVPAAHPATGAPLQDAPAEVSYTGTRPQYFWGPNKTSPPLKYLFGVGCMYFSLLLTIATFFFRDHLFELSNPSGRKRLRKRRDRARAAQAVRRQQEEEETKLKNHRIVLWLVIASIAASIVAGFILLRPFRPNITPFGHSQLVLYCIVWGVAAFALSIRYGEWLFARAAKDYISIWDRGLQWLISLLGLLCMAAGMWMFGKNNLPAYLVADIIFVGATAAAFIGITALAVLKGGEMLGTAGKWLMLLVGLWHALLQIAVPFLLVRKGTPLTWIVALALIPVAMYFGKAAMRQNRPARLIALWFVYGSVMLLLPYLTAWLFNYPAQPIKDYPGWWEGWPAGEGLPAGYSGWAKMGRAVFAGLFGSLMCCVWFGWYLAVCLTTTNGHNNESGGAARIENFKQFIRFRLTRETLTGYVIAVDDVSVIGEPLKDAAGRPVMRDGKAVLKDGDYLKPRIIDVFHLTVKGSAAAKEQAAAQAATRAAT